MDIADVARASGLPASTLRYYEDMGLIMAIGRHGLRRQYDAKVLERLKFISLGRSVGFSLEEISNMFTPDGPAINRNLLLDKAAELETKIKEMTAMRDGLRHAAACRASNHFECPKFLRLLHIAGKNRYRQPNKLRGKIHKTGSSKK